MYPTLRNILAILAGIIGGGLLNLGLVHVSDSIIPPPAGVDVTDMESLKTSIHLFGPEHFIFPFLAHALGTLAGACLAAWLAASHQMKIALGIGAFFLLGGIAAASMLPAPSWFVALDLIAAYIPMGWLGGTLAGGRA